SNDERLEQYRVFEKRLIKQTGIESLIVLKEEMGMTVKGEFECQKCSSLIKELLSSKELDAFVKNNHPVLMNLLKDYYRLDLAATAQEKVMQKLSSSSEMIYLSDIRLKIKNPKGDFYTAQIDGILLAPQGVYMMKIVSHGLDQPYHVTINREGLWRLSNHPYEPDCPQDMECKNLEIEAKSLACFLNHQLRATSRMEVPVFSLIVIPNEQVKLINYHKSQNIYHLDEIEEKIKTKPIKLKQKTLMMLEQLIISANVRPDKIPFPDLDHDFTKFVELVSVHETEKSYILRAIQLTKYYIKKIEAVENGL
ncbi:MAG: hypothetical protein ACRCS6_09470, partial [Turicibacter sp.]